jgi:hypothetical protein
MPRNQAPKDQIDKVYRCFDNGPGFRRSINRMGKLEFYAKIIESLLEN